MGLFKDKADRAGKLLVSLPLLFCIGTVNPSSLMAASVKQEWEIDSSQKGGGFSTNIRKLADLSGFQCSFDQLMTFADGGAKHYAGSLAILKPGRFRWQYRLPYDQLYIGDGQVIWHYEPDLMQAERLTDLETVNPVVMQLLAGHVKLSDITVQEQRFDSTQEIHSYKVHVADAPPVWLGFSKAGHLVSIDREDLLGNRNLMTLTGCSYVAPSEKLFSFTPPAGVEVLDLRSAEVLPLRAE
ncbi:LolA [Mariprofundus erugo]|nr:LolA [Mariprofundus erugo]